MKTLIKIAALALVGVAPLAPLAAQDSAPARSASEPGVKLESDVMAIITSTDETGRQTTTLAEPSEFTPGTRLSFGMNYSNSAAETATNVTGTNPLNEAVRLAPDADPALQVSVDGGKTFGTLDSLSVTTQNQATRAATHDDVTHVRWTIASIAPGESGRIGFPVIIR
jgi:hypothetical protein